MPTYEYECRDCGHRLEAFQRMTEQPLAECPACHKPGLKRKISAGAGIIFKGSGFYQTDYRSSDYRSASEKDKPAEAKPVESKPAETKPAPASG